MDGLAALAGRILRVVFRAILALRRPRPIHPHGLALGGRLTWLPGAAPSGIAWIDEPPAGGSEPVAARLSRSAGVPSPLPDVVGLALRVATPTGSADVELASTGLSFPSRFWLVPARSPSNARLTTLLPYRGARGPVLLAARTLAPGNLPTDLRDVGAALDGDAWTLRLYHSTPRGRWHPFATLTLTPDAGAPDTTLRFDAGRNVLPGAVSYRWVRLLRDPSYRLVQD